MSVLSVAGFLLSIWDVQYGTLRACRSERHPFGYVGRYHGVILGVDILNGIPRQITRGECCSRHMIHSLNW